MPVGRRLAHESLLLLELAAAGYSRTRTSRGREGERERG